MSGAGPRAGASLIVEGGGMRGFYSAGVLRALSEAGVSFPLVAGVSSGALCAAAFLAGCPGLGLSGLYPGALSFFSPAGLVAPGRGLVRTDRLFERAARACWEGVMASACELWVPAAEARSGRLAWWGRADFAAGPEALEERLRASASIPVVMPTARVEGRVFADGGIVDSVPVGFAEAAGYRRHVLLLTRPRGYVKGRQRLDLYLRAWLRPYPALRRAMLERHLAYNASVRRAERLEDEGRAFVFRAGPEAQALGRFEYSPAKAARCLEAGRRDALERLPELEAWLGQA